MKANKTMPYHVTYISEKPLFDANDTIAQLFKVSNTDYPFRIRLLDKSTREVGPRIFMYKSYAKALDNFIRGELL